jgi:hypothetical protein
MNITQRVILQLMVRFKGSDRVLTLATGAPQVNASKLSGSHLLEDELGSIPHKHDGGGTVGSAVASHDSSSGGSTRSDGSDGDDGSDGAANSNNGDASGSWEAFDADCSECSR